MLSNKYEVHSSIAKQEEVKIGGGLIHVSVGSPHARGISEPKTKAKMMSFKVWFPLSDLTLVMVTDF